MPKAPASAAMLNSWNSAMLLAVRGSALRAGRSDWPLVPTGCAVLLLLLFFNRASLLVVV